MRRATGASSLRPTMAIHRKPANAASHGTGSARNSWSGRPIRVATRRRGATLARDRSARTIAWTARRPSSPVIAAAPASAESTAATPSTASASGTPRKLAGAPMDAATRNPMTRPTTRPSAAAPITRPRARIQPTASASGLACGRWSARVVTGPGARRASPGRTRRRAGHRRCGVTPRRSRSRRDA